MSETPDTMRWIKKCLEGSKEVGQSLDVAGEHEKFMREAGIIDVQSEVITVSLFFFSERYC